MEIFGTNIFGRHKREAQGNGVPVTTDPNHPTNQEVKGGSYQERIVYTRSPQTALTIAAVHRAVELRAKAIGQMAVQYQRRDTERGNFVEDVSRSRNGYATYGSRMNYLLQVEPNPLMSAASLWQQVTVDRLLRGNGFVYIERNEVEEPVALWRATCGGYNFADGTYILTYFTERGVRNRVAIPRSDVLHFPNTFREDNGFWGISTLRHAYDTMTLLKTESTQALETAAKGGRVKAFIGEQAPAAGYSPISQGLFDPKQMKEYAKEINNEVYEQDIVSLRALDKVVPISMTAQDMQMIEIMNLSLDDTARFFGVPRPLLMMDTNSHYTSYRDATMELLSRTVGPDADDMEQEFFRKLLSIEDYGRFRIHMCEHQLLRMDKETQAKVDKMRLENGTATVNELRQEWDMPVVNDGDEPMASANLMTLKALIAKSDAAQQLKPGNYTVGEPPKEGEETA